ncbi:MAG: A/G-specific adenine glycosylase [Archangiaceae bacterium]|nr:A/G-specific adenine glycosylase [Archangiaceae bacterium]
MNGRYGAAPVRQALLDWFSKHKRDLPWRGAREPYAVWVSEVMLQQTQVSTVIPYYLRFLKRFPTVKALAKAPLAEVLGQWKGLGYYSRARNLHRAAQAIVEVHGGKLPGTAAGLLELPGFGRYTAGAVASIAFSEPAPIVDGNVARVFSRVHAIDAPVGDKARERQLWQLAEALVQGPRPGDLNEALMELGATVCLPKGPLCLLCPIRGECQALAQGRVETLPPPKVRAVRKRLELKVAVCRRDDRVLLARRPDGGLFGGLWELPTAASRAQLTRVLEGTKLGKHLATVERTLTHRDLVLELYATAATPPLKHLDGYTECRWVTEAETEPLGVSAAMQAALERVWRPAADL